MSSLNLKLPFCYEISECLNERQKLIKRFKYYSLLLFYTFYIVQLLFILNKLATLRIDQVPLYYFGVLHYVGGLPQFHYLFIIFCSLYSVQYLIIFNNKQNLRRKWMRIIKVLNTEGQPIHELGLSDINSRQIYLKHVNFMSKVVKTICGPYILNGIIVTTFFTAKHLSFIDFITYGIIALMITSIFLCTCFPCILYGFLQFFIVCYFCKIRLNAFNSKLNQMISDLFISQKKIMKTLKEFDFILNEINCFNQFWKSYIFSIYYTFIPILLFTIHSMLFEQELHLIFFTLILVLIMYSSIIIAFNLIMSSINKQSIILFKIWQKFYLKNENLLKSNIKIKVKIYFLKTKIQIKLAINFSFIKILNAMERLSSRNYPVGFSCADQFIVTRNITSKVNIIREF